MQPFITNEYLTLYSRTMNGKIENINYTFNETKKYVDESILTKNTNFWPKKLSLSIVDNNFGHHPLSTLFYGYRSTNQGDESMPALFYKANNVFVVRRFRLANDDDEDSNHSSSTTNTSRSSGTNNKYQTRSSRRSSTRLNSVTVESTKKRGRKRKKTESEDELCDDEYYYEEPATQSDDDIEDSDKDNDDGDDNDDDVNELDIFDNES